MRTEKRAFDQNENIGAQAGYRFFRCLNVVHATTLICEKANRSMTSFCSLYRQYFVQSQSMR